MWLKLLPYAGWPLAAMMFFFWLGAREDLAASVADCNTDKLAVIAEAEQETRELLQASFTRREAVLIQQRAAAEDARLYAEMRRADAVSDTADREAKIRRLMMEAGTDEIPDSNECLNVFVHNDALDGVRMSAGDRASIEPGGSSGTDEASSDSSGATEADPETGDFSNVTFGDTLTLWGRDRDTIETLNGQLQAIADLSNQLATE